MILRKSKLFALFMVIIHLMTVVPVVAEKNPYDFFAEINMKNIVYIQGAVDTPNAFVTFLLQHKDDQSIGYANQIEVDENGYYEYDFVFDKEISEYELSIKEGMYDVTNGVEVAYAKPEFKPEISGVSDGSIKLQCKVNNLSTKELTVCVAFYKDENRELVGLKTIAIPSTAIVEGTAIIDEVVEGVPGSDYYNVFFWRNFETMIPLAEVNTGNEFSVNASFGELMTLQETGGYEPMQGRTVWERYKQARAELPEEVPVVKNFAIRGEKKLYVSPDGDDNNDGSLERPLKNIQTAFDRVGQMPAKERTHGVNIYLREGTYSLLQPITITEEHSDLINNSQLALTAYNGEKVIISGTTSVTGDKAYLVTEENTASDYSRIHNDAKGSLYYINYSDLNITEMAGFRDCVPSGSVKLSCKTGYFDINNKALDISRYPDAANDYIEEIIDGGVYKKTPAIFRPVDKTVFSWKQTGKIGVYGQFCTPWSVHGGFYDSADLENQTITELSSLNLTNYPISDPLVYEGGGRARWYYYNILEETNLENEWCFDDEAQRVYFIPVGKTVNSDDVISVCAQDVEGFINANGVKNLIIDGISFKCAENGIILNGCKDTVIQNCSFNGITNVCVNGTSANEKTGVINSLFENSYLGVTLSGGREFKPYRNYVQNCYFTDSYRGVEGVGIGGIISHNFFSNIEGEAIYAPGAETVTEYNEITLSNLKGIEGTMIYTPGSYNAGRFHIRRNYLHDVRAPLSNLSRPGMVTLDDMGDSMYVYENIFDDPKAGTAGSHGGDDSVYDGNWFYKTSGGPGNSTNYYLNGTGSGRYYTYGLADPRTGSPTLTGDVYKRFYVENDAVFTARYPHLKNKIDFILECIDEMNADESTKTSDKNKWLGTDTGCYYVNNKFVGCNISTGPTKYGKSYVHNSWFSTVLNNPSRIKQKYGMDYNVVENNSKISANNFDFSRDIEFFDKIGIIGCENKYYNEILSKEKGDITITLPAKDGDKSNLEIVWIPVVGCEFYRVTFASDTAFKNVIYQEDLNESGFSGKDIDIANGNYYYKIEAYGLSRSKGNYMQIFDESPVYQVNIG